MRRGALGVAAVGPLSALPTAAAAQAKRDDIAALNRLLALEFVLVALFEQATDRPSLPEDLRRLAERTSDEDQRHVSGLKALILDLGGSPARQGAIRFGDIDDRESFLDVAVRLKELAVGAYSQALPVLERRTNVGSLASMLQIDARHAGRLRLVAGIPPAPQAFGAPAKPSRVRVALERYRRV